MNLITRRLVALTLLGLMAGLPGALPAAGRRGADVVVVRMDGVVLAGELIVVRPASIVVLTSDGTDSTIPVADIASVRVRKKSKGGIGALVGFAGGVALASLILSSSDMNPDKDDYMRAGFFLGLFGAAPGFLIGVLAGSDRTVKVAGQSPEKVSVDLAYLAKKARVREKL